MGTHFLDTSDNQPLEFRANARRVLRLEPDPFSDAPNLIAGSSSNAVGPGIIGATIGGGGAGNNPNRGEAHFGTIDGGFGNTIQIGVSYATSPGAALHVGSGDLLVAGTSNFVAGTDARLILGDGNNYVRALWGQGLRFGVFQGVDALVLQNGGNVGAGRVPTANRLEGGDQGAVSIFNKSPA